MFSGGRRRALLLLSIACRLVFGALRHIAGGIVEAFLEHRKAGSGLLAVRAPACSCCRWGQGQGSNFGPHGNCRLG